MTRPHNIRKKVEGYIVYILLCAGLALLLTLIPKKQTKTDTSPPPSPQQATRVYDRQYYEQQHDERCYVCTGSRSRKYHMTPTCPSSCRRSIIRLTVAEAIRKGYQPCHTCH